MRPKKKTCSFCNEFIKWERKRNKPLIFRCLLIKELNTLNFIPKKSASNLSVNLKNYLRFPVWKKKIEKYMKIVVEVKTKYKSQPLLSGQISTTKRDKWKYLQPTKESRGPVIL